MLIRRVYLKALNNDDHDGDDDNIIELYGTDPTTIIIAINIIHHCAVAQLIITVTIINTGDRVKQSLINT